MANTTNFGWETPDDTDLVKDGAAAIRTLGSAIDTSMVDLKGGSTGQVLAKATNTDMDFTWVTQDDANAIQNAIVTAKGDLISATGASTPAVLAVGTNGQFLTANSSASTGLAWTTLSSGGYSLISTTTLSGTQTNITIPSGYNKIEAVFQYVYNTTSGNAIYLKFNNQSQYYMEFAFQDGTYSSTRSGSQLTLSTNPTNSDESSYSEGRLTIYRPDTTGMIKYDMTAGNYAGSVPIARMSWGRLRSNLGPATALNVLVTTGGLSGTVYLYGAK